MELDRTLDIFGNSIDGNSFQIGQKEFAGMANELRFGFLTQSCSIELEAKFCRISSPESKNKKIPFETASILFHHPLKTEHIHVSLSGRSLLFKDNSKNTTVCFGPMIYGEEKGQSVVISTVRNSPVDVSKTNPCSKKAEISVGVIPQVVSLKDPLSGSERVSGGKGSSLGKLTEMCVNTNTFSVPNGVVVTTSAYREFVKLAELNPTLASLESTARSNSGVLLQEACEKTVSIVSKKAFPESIFKVLEERLKAVFKSNVPKIRFAVRSSAEGEDSEATSAAGQMDSFLGVCGLDQVSSAIVRCWASQFSYNAIQYKRLNGQPLNAPMAVVVQEMVSAEAAGVMFTCDPVTCNPARVTITANYGLGESVVSASAEPDTFVLQRDIKGALTVKDLSVGEKKSRTVMNDTEGTFEEPVSEHDQAVSCISNEVALKIGNIGVAIEDQYGCLVDVEWAVFEEKIYILQVRPITTQDRETDFEIIHDLDSPNRCEDEYLTKANVGEVMPGATSPLGVTTFIKVFHVCNTLFWHNSHKNGFKPPRYYDKGLMMSQFHMLMNVLDALLLFYKEGSNDEFTNGQMVSIFGRVLDDKKMLGMASRRNSFIHKLINGKRIAWLLIRELLLVNRKLKGYVAKHSDHFVDLSKCLTAKSMYAEILENWLKYPEIFSHHPLCTMASSMFNQILLTTLAAASGGWTSEVYSDLAYILSSCEQVESVDVPLAVEKLTVTIGKCIPKDEFQKMSTQEAFDWLSTTTTPAGIEFKNFLSKHGHRCVKEFDIFTQPWGTNPIPLVKILQDSVGNVSESCASNKKKLEPVKQIISNLKVRVPWKGRLVFRGVIPLARWAVGLRETSKSLIIKYSDAMRKATWTLAEQTVKEGLLPEKELLFFLSYYEVHELLKGNCPRLIQKAVRRKQMYPKLDLLRFPEITQGIPKHHSDAKASGPRESTFEMKGVPVSKGIVEGLARVANTLQDATEIQPGEILVAYSTDIGWSPYFPLLAGVATELGGLVSHGAVVAREYGLPCVVGLHGATAKFRTGDLVVLDGNTGVLKRVQL